MMQLVAETIDRLIRGGQPIFLSSTRGRMIAYQMSVTDPVSFVIIEGWCVELARARLAIAPIFGARGGLDWRSAY